MRIRPKTICDFDNIWGGSVADALAEQLIESRTHLGFGSLDEKEWTVSFAILLVRFPSALFAHRFAVEFDAVSVVNQPVDSQKELTAEMREVTAQIRELREAQQSTGKASRAD